jgi:hypothetical protein
MPKVNTVRKLTLAEVGHLSALLAAERDSGNYYGPREQYYARTERLIKWCSQQIRAFHVAEQKRGPS